MAFDCPTAIRNIFRRTLFQPVWALYTVVVKLSSDRILNNAVASKPKKRRLKRRRTREEDE